LASASGSGVNTTALQSAQVDFVFDPVPLPGQGDRHSVYNEKNGSTFALGDFPAALQVLTTPNPEINNASSQLSTTNEQGSSVAVGVARPQTTLVDWVLILEIDHGEAFAPTVRLRNILLACVFGTAGLVALLVIPMAHLSVLPIQRLKEATKVSVQTPEEDAELEDMIRLRGSPNTGGNARSPSEGKQLKLGEKFRTGMKNLWYTGRWQSKSKSGSDTGPRTFKLPGKVQERKHFITDELTELTSTFNEVSDELMTNYTKLEEKVQARTQELETSKKAAEAANESKTLFIASISHELKTPLNGILGMCAVCMGEDDLSRIKRSLQVIYKSGDLLLHLLNDLLTFSKNEIGQQLSLEEGEFTLSDIKTQIVSLFDKQIRESHISFGVKFVGTDFIQSTSEMTSGTATTQMLTAFGPPGTGRLKDMRLWGDIHRILQVIINLVSNSLKFTPDGGKVEVRITCIGDAEKSSNNSKTGSRGSKDASRRGSTAHRGNSPASNSSVTSRAHAGLAAISKLNGISSGLYAPGRSSTPPPANARSLVFEFEVEDNGPGIPPHLQQSIFEPFVQGDISLTKKYGGTGLGLSICTQLSTLLGGTITLKSTVGVGTTFNMRIPLKLLDGKASRQSSSTGVSGSTHPSILSGDDSHANVAGNSASARFENDPQPRLIGLSQPFFASALPLSSGVNTNAHHEAIDRAKAHKKAQVKFHVLVADDNLVNQEVVLR
jgi:osomolarity two-component system sensor histidine kinase SLN1